MDKSCLWRSWQSTNHSWSPSVAETLVVRKVLLAFKDKWSRDSQRFNNSVWVFLKYDIQRNSRRNQTTQQMNISTLWAHICSFSLTAERSDGGQTDVNINAKFVILSPRADTEHSLRHHDFVNKSNGDQWNFSSFWKWFSQGFFN